MIVSWKWLQDYVKPAAAIDAVVERLTMSGLNLEEVVPAGDDYSVDLEVTSNRPDCLGHIGIAREVGVLFGEELIIPRAEPPTSSSVSCGDAIGISVECGDLCPLYTGRVIRGVRIKPGPAWMQERLLAVGITPVNNVVDCTNYVMLECGQPLHAFDLGMLRGNRIVVRRPRKGERITAIDHREYELDQEMCIIADGERPVAIAGVMGGADSEVSESTVDLLIESAVFSQAAVRMAARKLALHSPSSYRFERGVSSAGVDWASRRCCELILQTAGGELAEGVVVAGAVADQSSPIEFRVSRVRDVLGIEIEESGILKTLQGIGARCDQKEKGSWTIQPPPWRADLTREIDLVEEIGRIAGYEQIPDNTIVPMVASTRTDRSRVLSMMRGVMNGAGFDEAMTPSLVPGKWSELCSPWSSSQPYRSSQPMLGVLEKASQNIGAVELARRSLIPSLLEARRINEYRGNEGADLFETAHVYLPSTGELPSEPLMMGFVAGRGFADASGVIRKLFSTVCPEISISTSALDVPALDPTEACEFTIDGQRAAIVGVVAPSTMKEMSLREQVVVAELNVDLLIAGATLIRRQKPVSSFPGISRDFNFIVSDTVRWESIEDVVRTAVDSSILESVTYRETFRNEARDGAGFRRVLLTVMLRSHEGTLTGDMAEQASRRIVEACQSRIAARLVGA